MTRSSRVRASDAAAVIRLTHELHELPADWNVRAQHALNVCATLFQAELGFFCVVQQEVGAPCSFRAHATAGPLEARARHYLDEYARANFVQDPIMPALLKNIDQPHVIVRQELITNSEWYRSAHYNEIATVIGVDDRIYATFPLHTTRGFVGIGLHRAYRARAFGSRERVLAQLLETPLRGLAALAPLTAPDPLPPYLQRVRAALLRGESRKQIARSLGLSVHSVNAYIKTIYSRLHVSSRAELMAALLGERSPQP